MPLTRPILDRELADQFFGGEIDASTAAELRDALGEFAADVASRLQRLQAGVMDPAFDGKRELHQLRGVVANFGLARAAERLTQLEHAWNNRPVEDRLAAARAAAEETDAGIAALREAYPFLTGPITR